VARLPELIEKQENMADTKTNLQCQNIAPISNLNREINSTSLKIGVFANNGSGKTFISRLFRLTENLSELILDADGKSPTDKIISLGKNNSNFSFSVTDKLGIVKENFKISLNKGEIPIIPKTEYIYHTFNQDYVEENIRALSYDKDSEVEGFILGKMNIDLKDEEAELLKVEKEGIELSKQIEKEINTYVEDYVSNIQNIKRLGEYKTLQYQHIFNNIDNDTHIISKTFDELIEDYNKIKSVPENLEDIKSIEKPILDLSLIDEIQTNCLTEYSLSSIAEAFKKKIKEKQVFIETGMELLNNSDASSCPFCEQKIENEAIVLIDNYTKYLNDTEAKTIKQFINYIEILEKHIEVINNTENTNIKRINEFNIFKTKYIPSSEEIDLLTLETTNVKNQISELINSINEKLKNIAVAITINDDFKELLEKNQTLLNRQIELNNEEIIIINGKKNKIDEQNKSIRNEICKSAYNHLMNEHKTNIKSVVKLRNDWLKLNDEIKKKKEQQKVSKRDKVASTIKIVLNYFFNEKYSLDEETFRIIFNKNTLEKNQASDILSEGEKNIVAFAYYIGDTHLKIETEDDYLKLFFVIDDPISSMDFSHVYTLCGVIRDISKIIDKLKRERLLIFTHNNDFMRVLASNNIVDKKLLLKNGELKDFNNNLTVPYINHLIDIFKIARMKSIATHTTANSIRHIIETLTKFESIEISTDSVAEYIRENIPNDKKSYTLINDLSHGGWRTEQSPITDEDYTDVCETIIKHIEIKYKGQIEHCKKISA
jgi:wobble nucleotide-excising tRNase